MTALSECVVEKEGLHGLASRIKLIDSDCWMDRGAARENRTMLLCKGRTHDANGAKLSQRKRRKNQSTKCVCVFAFATWNMHYRNTWVTWVSVVKDIVVELANTETAVATVATPPIVMLNFQKATNWSKIWGQWELIEHSVGTNTSASQILVQRLNFRF